MEDLISIIVTIYNDEQYLKECILSIIGQTYRNMEIILIDDGSLDSSPRICDELLISNSRMKVFHQMHSGTASARNKGLELASGKFITFLNGCDKLDKNFLDNLHEMISSFDVEIAMCSTYTNIKENPSDKIITLDKEDTLRQLLIEQVITNTPCGKIFSRELFEKVKFSDSDADTVCKLVEKSQKVAFMNNQCYYMRNIERYSFTSSINKNTRLMKLYPDLAVYCKCNIIKNTQDEFFDAITNNRPVIDEDKIYDTFKKIVIENDTKITPFMGYVRRAHMYLLANDKNNYRIICPVLPDLFESDLD